MYIVSVNIYTKYGHYIFKQFEMYLQEFEKFQEQTITAIKKLKEFPNTDITLNYISGVITGIIGIDYNYKVKGERE